MGALPYPAREAVFSALFTVLETAPGFTTFSRRMLDYSAVAPGLLPILMLWEQPEDTDYRPRRGLPRDYWEALAVIVFQNKSKVTQGNPNSATPGATRPANTRETGRSGMCMILSPVRRLKPRSGRRDKRITATALRRAIA